MGSATHRFWSSCTSPQCVPVSRRWANPLSLQPVDLALHPDRASLPAAASVGRGAVRGQSAGVHTTGRGGLGRGHAATCRLRPGQVPLQAVRAADHSGILTIRPGQCRVRCHNTSRSASCHSQYVQLSVVSHSTRADQLPMTVVWLSHYGAAKLHLSSYHQARPRHRSHRQLSEKYLMDQVQYQFHGPFARDRCAFGFGRGLD